jgi:hypothetical protein
MIRYKELKQRESTEISEMLNLAGLKKILNENCGTLGMGMPRTPATINITASSGPELTGMLKDIMSLAGVHKVEQDNMPISVAAGPAEVVSNLPDMKDIISIVDKPEHDSMNDYEEDEVDEMYDNSPDETSYPDPVRQHGNVFNKTKAAKDALVTTEETLYQAYQEFISEAKAKCCCKEKSKAKCSVHGKNKEK